MTGVILTTLHALKATLKARFDAESANAEASRPKRRYEVLAEELRALITGGALKVGEPLPAERDLVDLTGLGRGSVREAIRILEIEGLLAPKKPGRNGMSVVQNASDQTVQRQLELFIGGDRVSNEQLLEARLIIEPALAKLAAANRSDDDIARLRDINAVIGQKGISDVAELVQLNLDWHTTLFHASGNDLMAAIATGLTKTQHTPTVLHDHGEEIHIEKTLQQHDAILAAVVDGNGDLASDKMRCHLEAYRDSLAQLNPPEFELAPLSLR